MSQAFKETNAITQTLTRHYHYRQLLELSVVSLSNGENAFNNAGFRQRYVCDGPVLFVGIGRDLTFRL